MGAGINNEQKKVSHCRAKLDGSLLKQIGSFPREIIVDWELGIIICTSMKLWQHRKRFVAPFEDSLRPRLSEYHYVIKQIESVVNGLYI